jgi:hypothetical protein
MAEPIYNINGQTATKSELAAVAKERGITLDEYIKLSGATLSGKTTDSADATDPNAESGNTGSTSAEDFSVSRLGEAEVQLDEFGDPVTIKAWEEETNKYIDENPELTADELSEWINRPGGPTESQYSFQEEKEIFEANKENPKLDNPNYSPSNFIIDLYEDPGFNKNKPALSAYDNELEFLKNKQKDYSIMSTESADIQSQINQLEYNKENELENNRTATSRARNNFTQKINEADAYWNDNQAKFQSGEITPEEFAAVERNYNNKRENIFQNSYEKDRYEEQTLLLDEISTAKTKDTYSSFGSSDLGESKEEQIKFDQKVEDEIINKLYSDNKLKGKTLDGNLNLEGKEMLITEAKSKVLNQSYEEYLNEYDKAQEIIFAADEASSVTPEAAAAAQAVLYSAADKLQTTSTKLAFNIGEQSFDNNFQMTEDFIEWRDRHIDGGFVGGAQDFIGTLVQGGQKIIGESIVGSAIWLNRLAFTGMGTFEEDEYSRLDMVSDMFSNYNSFNYMGVSPKGGSLSEDGISFRSASKTIANMLPFTIGVALAARKGDMKGLKNAYSVLRGMGASASTINKIKMGGFAFRATVNDNYMEGKQMGLDNAQALAYSSMTSTATAVVQGIMPDVNFFKTNVGKSMLGTVVENLKKATTKEARKAVGKQFVNNLLGEIGEEEAELLLQDMAKITVGLSNETKFTDFDTQFETIGGTILLAGSTSTVMAPAQFSNFKNKIYNQYRTQGADIIKTLQESKKVVETKLKRARTQQSKDAAQRQLDEINSAIEYGGDIIKAINVAPDVMNDEQIDLLIQKNQLLDKKAKADKRYTKGVDAEIEAIDAKIEASQVKQQSSIIEERTEAGTKKIADALGITFTKGKGAKISELIAQENAAREKRNKGKSKANKEKLINANEALAQNGFTIQNADGTQTIVVNEDVAGTNKAVTTAQHELLHGVLLKTITDNPGAIVQMGNALRSEIDKMLPNDISFNNAYIQGRLEAYKADSSSVKAEELLTIFSEGLTQGFISFEENAFTKLGDFIRQGLQRAGMNVTFNSGRDVFNFIKDFNKSVISGKGLGKGLTKAAKEGAKVGKKLGNTSAFLYNANFEANIQNEYNNSKLELPKKALKIAMAYRSRVQELINKSSNNVFGTAEKANAVEYALIGKNNPNSIYNTVLNYNNNSGITLDAIIGKTVSGIGETAVTEKYSRASDKAKEALNSISFDKLKGGRAQSTIGTELSGMVKAQIIGRFNISDQAANDFTDEVVERIYLAQETTKWNGKGDLYGFINGRIALRIKDVVRQEYKKNPGERLYLAGVDSNQFETLENAGNIVDEETTVEKTEKPKYKKLKDSNVLPGAVVNELKLKLIPILRVLKSKINAPTSLNVKVKPMISELKKEFGKQFDIVLKKAMGGKKDGQLSKFLLKNKKAILENMTTTWLMGAMPGAIQKQVDGKFISNWEGKKIDRETTTTDNAGRTAGADIVRRKPNVANMSDTEFLGYVVDEKGNPIRGRKESLAKALGEELGFETFLEEIQKENSPVNEAFVANQELLGAIMADNLVEQVADMIDRGTVKYSKTLSSQEVQSMLFNLVSEATRTGADSNAFQQLKTTYPDEVVKIGEEIGLFTYFDEGKTGFKKPLAEFPVPKMFEEQFYTYFSTITNKNVEVSMEQLAKFSETLIDALPPELLAVLPDDMFGIQYGYLDGGAKKADGGVGKYNWLANKKREKQKGSSNVKLPFDPKGIEIFNAGYGLMGNIATILNKEYPTAQAKQDAVMEKFGERIAGANATNKIALDYLISEASKILAKKPELVPGFLRWMEASTSNAKAQRGLTTLDLIEYRAESQKPGDTHPLYKEAVKYATDLSTEMFNRDNAAGRKLRRETTLQEFIDKRLANSKTGPLTHLRFKGEHVTPAANVMVDLAKNAIGAARLISKNSTAEVQILADLSLKNSLTLENYSQTLGAKLYSDIQDQALGTTSKLGDLRNLVLKESDFNNFYSIDGRTGVDYVKDKIISIDAISQVIENIDIESLANTISGQNAINLGIKYSKTPKKIRVFDFDDTLARTKSNVLYTMPDGTKGKIDAATFAKDAAKMEAEGAEWDFAEFSKVMNGTKGPLFEVAKIIGDKSGTQDLFVLTARPQDAAGPIQEFLAGLGLDIPVKNITGLGNGTPKAKADWVVNKLAEGYNDFYFADDHTGNVKAVKDALSTLDVKSKVQQARIKFSKNLDADFNSMIERNKGVNANAEFSKVVAKRRGAGIGRFKLWMPSSLDDFKGLTSYVFAGKGRQGDADQKFFKDALITPYFRGVAAIETARQTLKNDFKALNKAFKPVREKLGKLTPDGDFTYDAAIRVYLWTQAGIEVPGISKRDQAKLNKLVEGNDSLVAYAKALMLISKKDSWNPPAEYWDSGTILSDLNEMTEKIGRKEYIAEFIENVDIIFSEKNLNKVQALYGTRQRDALEDIIYRMKNGTNRPSGGNKTVNRWNNWVNNSVGAIMFFNRRSALLQLLSTVNFINWSDNNPAKAALAFANQPQYWKDFVRIFNSDKLKQRRSGLKSDVNEAEIANAAKGAKNKASAVISYLLKIGFTPTQLADSFAIAAGGAAFYRNRVKTLVKKGMTLAQAEKQAFQDFSEISEETQQSGDAALISSDQASVMGRLVLAFQNTPIQLNRSIKKAALDIYNRRRTPGQTQAQSDFSNLSKMVFYGAIQNIIFSTLQNALFALLPGFDDDELTEDELDKLEETKISRILNGMVDTTLKGGFGLPGAVVSTIKNVVQEYNKQDKKGFTADHTYTILQVANLSPPIGSKLRKIYSAIQAKKFEKDVIAERGFDVTLDGKFNLSPSYNVLGAVVEGATNLPLERVTLELQSLTEAMDTRNTIMQRIALGLGWKSWDVGAENEEHDLIKLKAKAERKEQGKIKAKKTRARNREIEKQRVANLTPEERKAENIAKAKKRKASAAKRREAAYEKAKKRGDSLKKARNNKKTN